MGPYLQYLNFLALNFKERFRKLNKKKLIIVLAVISLCVFIPKVVYGIPVYDIDDWLTETIFTTVDALFEAIMTAAWFLLLIQIIATLSNVFMGITASLMNWAITLNTSIPLTHCPAQFTNCLVDAGWAISRDLANMFFILALVFIAFATILGIESYGVRRMIVPLILIAIIINFSQVLLGVVVDFASVFIQIFSERLLDVGKYLTIGFMQQLSALASLGWSLLMAFVWIICPPCGAILTALGVQDPITAFLVFLMKTFILIANNVLMGVLFLILGGLFLLRIPMIWLLTIIAPMALVCYLFPFLRSKYKWWIDQVGQWVFIGVFALFFIYLGISLWDMVWSPDWGTVWGTAGFGSGILMADLGPWMVNYVLPGIVFMLFLFVALQFAQKTNAIFAAGIIGAGVALGRTIKGRAESWTPRYARGRARKAMAPERLERRARTYERLGFKGRAMELREDVYKKTRGYMEEGESRGKKVSPQEAARMYWNNTLDDPYKNLGLMSAHADSMEEFWDEGARRGYNPDRVMQRINESLVLARTHHDPTLKKIVKGDLRLAQTATAQDRVNAAGRISEVMSPAEQANYPAPQAERIASIRLWMKDRVKPGDFKDMDAAAFEHTAVQDALLRQAKLGHLLRIAYDNPRAKEHVQSLLTGPNALTPAARAQTYPELERMIQDPAQRRRLESAGWRF